MTFAMASVTTRFAWASAPAVVGAVNSAFLTGILYQMAGQQDPREQSVVEFRVCQRYRPLEPMASGHL